MRRTNGGKSLQGCDESLEPAAKVRLDRLLSRYLELCILENLLERGLELSVWSPLDQSESGDFLYLVGCKLNMVKLARGLNVRVPKLVETVC